MFGGAKYALLMFLLVLNSSANASQGGLALVYRGPAGCDDCSSAIADALKNSTFHFDVQFIGPNEKLKLEPSSFIGASLYVQPGGGQDIDGARKSLGKAGIQSVRDFISKGGRYLGICMGAYLATDLGFNIVDGETDSEVGRPGFPVSDIGDYVVPIKWKGSQLWTYYQDGPYLPKNDANSGFLALAHYQTGDVAAARYSYGKGSATLIGPHPEAPQDWYDNYGLHNPDGVNSKLIQGLLDAAMAE
ncbi:BPL-N domain-containing protein [Phyllobacterium meliloti]|uniref:BPL-N domain-containing protein n=1 Tax=Phyllobacterium meliloti TaxID=555317 RepID=UPI001D14C3FD|nr:BPL-N domain-containing protein [Phyllobacterium sp. T1293]UGX87162.1 BPL-N domain-containing protein [Phyllobacterium sp. T1293]